MKRKDVLKLMNLVLFGIIGLAGPPFMTWNFWITLVTVMAISLVNRAIGRED